MASILGVETLQHTNGTTAATIDSSGRILTPARPAFFAYLNAHQSNASNTYFKVAFNDTVFNVGSNFDTTNNRFVAPIDGIYQFNTSINPDMSSGTATRFFGYFSVDGSRYAAFAHMPSFSNDRGIINGSITLELNANQYVEVETYADGGTTVRVNGNSSSPFDSYINGFLVG